MAELKRKLNCHQGLLNDLKKDEREQETTFNLYNNKKSQTQQYEKKLLNDQQKQVKLIINIIFILTFNIFKTNLKFFIYF